MTPDANSAPWREALTPYSEPNARRGWLSVLTSAVPYVAVTTIMNLTLGLSLPLTIALGVLAAGFLVRVFVMFHDCTHTSLLPSRRANVIMGHILGLMVLSPYTRWRHDHAIHHATSGDLDKRGTGDVPTLTVEEYQSRSWKGRLGYRLFRNPVVMFGIGPIFAMMIGPRLVSRDAPRRMRVSVLGTDAAIAVAAVLMCWMIGWEHFLLVWGPAAMLAGSAGIWLFYVQHQFEDAYWQGTGEWSYADAALRGSSYLKMPALLRFFSGNIGLHHVHHLNPRVPNYYLPAAHASHPVFSSVPTLSVADGMRAIRLKLYDPRARRMVTFAEARTEGRLAALGRIG